MDPKSNMTFVLINRGEETETHRQMGEGQAMTEAEIEMTHVQARQYQESPAATLRWVVKEACLPRPFRGRMAWQHLSFPI